MNKTFLSVYIIAATIFIYGCATQRLNLSKNGRVVIERIPSEKVFIPWADAYQDGNDLLVEGIVEQRYLSNSILKAHIDATIFSTKGIKLQEGRTKAIYVPGRRIGKGIKWERFRIRFPQIPPERVKIEVVAKPGEHGEKD